MARLLSALLVHPPGGSREALARILSALDLSVQEADDAAEGLAALARSAPDLVLLDLGSSPEAARAFAGEVRDRFGAYFVPIVLLTERNDARSRRAFAETGAHDFAAKPVVREELEARLKALLGLKALHDHLQESRALLELKTAELGSALDLERKFLEEVRAENERMAGLLTVDNLTGLYNHGHFMERLKAQIALCRRHKTPFAAALVDLDRFRALNEAHGHAFGNLYLRKVAETLLGAVRTTDIVARYGPDRFALILPFTPPDGALALVEKLRAAIGRGEFAHEGRKGGTTASAGVLAFGDRHERPETFMREIEDLVGRAKRAGGNRVEQG